MTEPIGVYIGIRVDSNPHINPVESEYIVYKCHDCGAEILVGHLGDEALISGEAEYAICVKCHTKRRLEND